MIASKLYYDDEYSFAKSVRIGSFSGHYFPAFDLNTERYEHFSRSEKTESWQKKKANHFEKTQDQFCRRYHEVLLGIT